MLRPFILRPTTLLHFTSLCRAKIVPVRTGARFHGHEWSWKAPGLPVTFHMGNTIFDLWKTSGFGTRSIVLWVHKFQSIKAKIGASESVWHGFFFFLSPFWKYELAFPPSFRLHVRLRFFGPLRAVIGILTNIIYVVLIHFCCTWPFESFWQFRKAKDFPSATWSTHHWPSATRWGQQPFPTTPRLWVGRIIGLLTPISSFFGLRVSILIQTLHRALYMNNDVKDRGICLWKCGQQGSFVGVNRHFQKLYFVCPL